MCSKMLKANEAPNKFELKVHHLLDRMTARYERMLTAVMAHRPVVIAFAFIVLQVYQCCLSSFQVSLRHRKIKG